MTVRTSAKRAIAGASVGLMIAAVPAQAGLIERACNSSDRSGGNSTLCACIQAVADQVLSPSEQRLGAGFFKDPHKSQEIRQSDRQQDEVFWLKWKQFGEVAGDACR